MNIDTHGCEFRAATVRERFRALRSRAATAVFVLLCATMAHAASAQDLITVAEVEWHIESLDLDDAGATRVQYAAERANAEAGELADVFEELGAWRRSLRGPGGLRMQSLLPNGLEPYMLDWFAWQRAEHEIASSLVDGYFDELEMLSDNAGLVEMLRNAHAVAHFADANNIRQEKLRDLVANVMPEDEAQRAAIGAALAQHEKNLAAIYREWREAELADVPDRVAAWAERDFEEYLEASLRTWSSRIAAREEMKRAGNQILATLSGDDRAKLNRGFRRVLYPPSLANLMDDFDKAMARPDLPDATREALLARRERFYEEYDRILDERIEIHEGFYDRETLQRMIEAGVRNSFYGEPIPPDSSGASQDRMARMQEWARQDRVFSTDVEAILREHDAVDLNERLQVMSAPLAADVPAQTDPTWRFFYSNPVFGRPDLERMLDAVPATDDQRTLARALYDDYRRELQEKAEELGRTVTELDAKREAFKRENPDAAQGEDWRIVGNEYGRLDSQWTIALIDFTMALWEDMETLFEESQRRSFERAAVDALWERLNQQWRSGNMGGDERHLIAVVEEAFLDGSVPAEIATMLEQYRDELWALVPDVQRRLKAVELDFVDFRDRLARDDPDYQRKIERAMEPWMALMRAPAEFNARYRDLLLAAANEQDREILQRAFDKEVHPELFVPSPIDLLARELEEIEASEGGEIDQDGFDTARSILDNARAQYERNTRALMAAKKEWSGEGSEVKWHRWQEDHPPPDPARPHLDRAGPMDDLWDQRRDIAKNACATVARLFPPQERSELPAGIQLLLMWAEGKN